MTFNSEHYNNTIGKAQDSQMCTNLEVSYSDLDQDMPIFDFLSRFNNMPNISHIDPESNIPSRICSVMPINCNTAVCACTVS